MADPKQWDNPIQTDGFEFVEYAAPNPKALGALFERLGFRRVAQHRRKDVALYKQGDVNFILNAEPHSFAQNFARRHGPSVCAMAFRVRDAAGAYEKLVERGAWGVQNTAGPGELNIPAQNLDLFMQIGQGVDDETWLYHLRQGDYSHWHDRAVKDDELVEAVRAVERDRSLSASESRARIGEAIAERYTVAT